MTVTDHPTDMSDDGLAGREPAVARRHLLRGGAVLAGVAGLTVAAAAVNPAGAATGDNLVLGEENEAETPTTVRIGGTTGAGEPTLRLINTDGPALFLDPLADDWDGGLQTGEIANTTRGPLIGIDQAGDTVTTPLLTEQDVWLPFVLNTPLRLLDTRTAEGRLRITQPSPLTADGRLPARRSLTFWIAPSQAGFGIPGLFLNLTVVSPATGGHAVVYPGPTRPPTSTVNFGAGQTVANGAMIGTSIGTYQVVVDPNQPPEEIEAVVINVYTTAAAWIVVDATAAFATGAVPPVNEEGQRRTGRRESPVARARRTFGKLR